HLSFEHHSGADRDFAALAGCPRFFESYVHKINIRHAAQEDSTPRTRDSRLTSMEPGQDTKMRLHGTPKRPGHTNVGSCRSTRILGGTHDGLSAGARQGRLATTHPGVAAGSGLADPRHAPSTPDLPD